MKSSIAGILLLVILCAGAFYAGRRTATLPQPTVVRDTVPGDSVPYPVYTEVPAPRVVVSDTVTKWLTADTAAILAAYFAKACYSDTLKNDTSAFIALTETVTQNRIVERSLLFQNRRPTAVITSTTVLPPDQEPKLHLYGGALMGKDMAAPMLGVGWERWQVGAGYNLQKGGAIVGISCKIR